MVSIRYRPRTETQRQAQPRTLLKKRKKEKEKEKEKKWAVFLCVECLIFDLYFRFSIFDSQFFVVWSIKFLFNVLVVVLVGFHIGDRD